MKTVPLGKTGVEVSTICLGTMYFGNRDSKSLSYRLLDQYANVGGAFLDTANIYSFWIPNCAGGESEMLIGDWLRERRNRNQLFIATKMGFAYPGVEKGLRASQIELECEKSLKRLGTDVIDLYYAHGDDRTIPIEETMTAFDRLVKAGKVRFLGASNFRAWRLQEANLKSQLNGWVEYSCVQQRYSFVRPKPSAVFEYSQVAANDDLLDYCQSASVTLLAYSVLLNGAYTRSDRAFPTQYLGLDTDVRLSTLKTIAVELSTTINQVIIAWLLQSDNPIIPVIGASSSEQLSESLSALSLNLNQEQIERLNNASA